MNKNLTKIAALSVSLAMAIGVGVALGSKAVRSVRATDGSVTINNATSNTDGVLTVAIAKASGSNAPITGDYGVRLYAKNTVTITSSSTITALTIPWTKNSNKAFASVSADVGTYTHPSAAGNGIWSGSATSIVLTVGDSGQVQFNSVSYTVSGSSGPAVNLVTVSPTTMTLNLQGTTSGTITPTVNASGGADETVTWSVLNDNPTDCVSVSDAGVVTAEAEGTATVRATSTFDGTKYADCAVTVLDEPVVTFELVTSATDLEAGSTYAITNGKEDGSAYAMSNAEQLKYRQYTSVTVSDNTFEAPHDLLRLTLSGSTDEWVFTTENYEGTDGVLYPSSASDKNELYVGESDSTATISFSDDAAIITLSGNSDGRGIIRWNNTAGQERFSCYKSGQQPIYLWKEVGEAKPEMEIWDTSSVVGSNTGYYFSNTSELYSFYTRESGATSSDPAIATTTWTSSNTSVATIRSDNGVGRLTTVSLGETTLTATAEGYETASVKISIVGGPLDSITVSGSMTKTAYTTNDTAWDPTGLTVTADYWYYEGADVTDEVEWTFAPAVPAEGVTSVVATASFEGETADSDAQVVTVTVAHSGSVEDPFTVAEGIAKAKEIGTTADGPWVTQGIICKVDEWNSEYPNITYWISDTGFGGNDPTTTIQCHRGKYLEGAAITADNYTEFVVGATVVVTGNLVNYNGNTPEYAANNYPLSLVQPSSGDFDVTFVAPQNIEVGDTGLFEATADTANPEFAWYTSDSNTLNVDSSTGAWEALRMGTVRITVSVVDGDKTGTAFADIVVNGGALLSVGQAGEIAASLPNGATSEYYVYVEGYVAEFATSLKDGDATKPRAIDIFDEDETNRMEVYTNVDPYAAFVDGLALGDAIRIKGQLQNYNGKYEIVNPVRTYYEYVALSFAFELLDRTDDVCENYDGVTNNHDELEILWGNLAVKYNLLNDAQKNRLMDPEAYCMGQTVLDAMARYDYITGKYNLTNFITGRTPTEFVNPYVNATNEFNNNSNTMIIVISAIAAVSVASIAVLLVIKKRKHN